MVFYENKDISIVCPKCGKFLLKADKRDNRVSQKACRKCNKLITYKPSDRSFRKISEIPPRQSSSGVIFW